MPRTKFDRLARNPVTYQKTVNRIIRTAMAREDIPSGAELGRRLGVDLCVISSRFTGRTKHGWSIEEIWRMDDFLHFTPDEITRLIRG